MVIINEIKRAPYICTVPGGGVRATKCYPDAQTYVINGKKFGYSQKEQTLITPIYASGSDISAAEVAVKAIKNLSLSS